MKSPTFESLAKLKHLLRYLSGTKDYVLRTKPSHMLEDCTSSLDIVCYVDSDWAGYSKTLKSTSGSTAQILGSDMIHTQVVLKPLLHCHQEKSNFMRLGKEQAKHCF